MRRGVTKPGSRQWNMVYAATWGRQGPWCDGCQQLLGSLHTQHGKKRLCRKCASFSSPRRVEGKN